jgi:hypothetical protein
MKIKNETLEAARASSRGSEGYGFTVDSLEPYIWPIDASAFYASAGISLRRIADALEDIAAEMKHNRLKNDRKIHNRRRS